MIACILVWFLIDKIFFITHTLKVGLKLPEERVESNTFQP